MPRETGGSEIYVRRLVPALLEARDDLRLTLFVAREAEESLRAEPWSREVGLVRLPVRAERRTRRVLAEQTLLPAAVRKARVDLLHNAFSTAPAAPGAPQVTTILDVIYKLYPETHEGLLAKGMSALVSLAARRSRRILTLSEAAKDDIAKFLLVDRARIDVTPLGPGLRNEVRPVPEEELRRRLDLGSAPIILTVSAKRPHKNLERLFEAFVRLSAPEPPVLVVPGYKTPFEAELRRRAAAAAGQRIRFAGWLDDATLAGLYQAAACLVFPSLAEGFGLPVLEAMRSGLPVSCSNTSSLPEIAGDAAQYFDPTDADDMARAVSELLQDSERRETLRLRGLERARTFSWERTAEATLASYARALGE
ncbi:MAG: glycosyltransferase family 1 protein [Gaiellaceae bacterium]